MKIKSMKFVKSALSILLVLLMLLSCGVATITAATVDLVSVGDKVIYYNNTNNWSDVNAYYWGGSNGPGWPGNAMTKIEGTNIYQITVPSGHNQIIFNNGSSQTGDLTIPTDDKNYYNNGNWETYTPPTPAQPGDDSNVSIRGTFDNWGDGYTMKYTEDLNIVTYTMTDLVAGDYELKIKNDNSWNGNNGSFTDTISDWTMDGNNNLKMNATGGTYTFTYNISQNKLSVAHTPAIVYYTATFENWDGTELDTDEVESGSTPVYSGTTPTKPGNAQYTYTFSGWKSSADDKTYTTLPAITTNTTFTAQFTQSVNDYTVTVTVNPTEGGTVSGGGTYAYGSTVTLTAVADSANGYVFIDWDNLPDDATYSNDRTTATFTVKGNVDVTAKFMQVITYNVSVESANSTMGTATKNCDNIVGEGAVITLTADPKEGYIFTGWDGLPTGVDSSLATVTFEVNQDVTATANFREIEGKVSFRSASTAQGTVSNAGGTVKYSGEATATATGTTAYEFASWTISGGNVGSDYRISSGGLDQATLGIKILNDGANITATANFKIKTYTVTFLDGFGGTVDTQTVNHGSAATAPANPTRDNYTFTSWDKSFNNITADTTVTAQWEAKTYTVTVTAGTGGTATSDVTSFTYSETGSVTLTAATDGGYKFDGWTISGTYTIVGNGNLQSTTLTIRPTSDITATPSFSKGEYIKVYFAANSSTYGGGLHMWQNTAANNSGTSRDLTGGWDNRMVTDTVQFGTGTWYNRGELEFNSGYNAYVGAMFIGTGQTSEINVTSVFYPSGNWVNQPAVWIYYKSTSGSTASTAYEVTFRTELNATYNANKDITDIGYTPESWADFTDALEEAGKALSSKSADQTRIDAANTALITAKNNLQLLAYHTITFNMSGYISDTPGTITCDGQAVDGTFQAVAGREYIFTVSSPYYHYIKSITGADSAEKAGNEWTYTVKVTATEDREVNIVYDYNPIVSYNGNVAGGQFTVNNNATVDNSVSYNSAPTVNITAPNGYYITSVKVNGVDVSGNYSNYNTVFSGTLSVVTEDTVVDVTYEAKPTVNVTENEDGKVTINGTEQNSATVEFGTTPTISITAPEGFYISSILVDGTSKYTGSDESKLTYTINDTSITADTNIIVTYTERTKYTITVEAYDDTKGTLSVGGVNVPAAGKTWEVYEGENVTITATPAIGQSVASWTVNGSAGYSGVTELNLANVTENKTIAITWKEISVFSVTVDANPYGAGTATGTVNSGIVGATSITSLKGGTQTTQVEENGAVTFTATVTDKIYKFTGWKITGAHQLTDGTISDTTITLVPKGNVTVTATYEQAYKAIYLDNKANWSTVKIHYWNDDKSVKTDWPGETMTLIDSDNKRYVAYIPMDVNNVIFNPNGDSGKTQDLVIPEGKNLYHNDKTDKTGWYEDPILSAGYYLQGTWNDKTYSAYDNVKFDENRDGTYTVTIDVTSAPDGYILVTPSDEKSNFWVPSTDLDTTNPTTLSKSSYAATHNQVKVPLDMAASENGYRVTFTFNPETGAFSWTAVAKVPTITVYGTDGFKTNDAGDGVGNTYFELSGTVFDKESHSNYEKAEVAKDEYFTIYTQVESAPADSGFAYEWYVAGYVIDGKTYVTADPMGNGLYSADISLSETDADIVPIYFHTKDYLAHHGIKTTIFYAIIPQGIENWTVDKEYLSAYTWYYKDEEKTSCYAPFGEYPGQLMIPITGLNGVYYTIVEAMAPGKNTDGSTIYVDGVTLNNYNKTSPSNENETYVQTYDFYEFLSYTIQGLENITFVLKNHNDKYNKLDVNKDASVPGSYQFVPLTNYNNDVIDLFGNVMDKATQAEQTNFNAAVAEGKVIHAIRVGNKDYRDTACTITHYDAKTGKLVDCPLNGQWYVDMYLYDAQGNFLVRCHSYQLSDGNLWQLFNDQHGTNYASRDEFLEDYTGYAVKVSYETDTVVNSDGGQEGTTDNNNASTSNRFDGEWFADTDNSVTIDISVNVGLSTDEGASFEIATDADGNPTNTAAYGSALVNGAATVSVTRNSQVTLYAQRQTGYRFVGWAGADGKIFSKNISVTLDAAIATSYTAVYQKLADGMFYLNHYIYNGEGTADKDEIPTSHNGRGDLYVQIEKLDSDGNVIADTGLVKDNTTYLEAQEGETLRLTIATDPAGLDNFFAWYVNAVNSSGLSTYEEVGVDSEDNLAMLGNGGTYTNPNTVIGSKEMVYFQFSHTVGKQFNITLYSDMIRVSSEKKLVYKYFDRYDRIQTYVVNYELTPDEIVGFEGNDNNPYTPSYETISKYAPFVGDYYKDVQWVITDFAQDECLLWAQNKTKFYTVTTVINDELKVEQVPYNTQFTIDAAEQGGFSRGGFWYEDTNGNKQYDKGTDRVIGNGTWYSYLVTDNRTIGYVPEKLDDFNVTLNEPEFGREQSTDSDGNNKVDKVYVDVVVNMVTPFVYGDGSGFEPYYHGPITDKNMAGNMVTIESLKKAGYEITFGVLYEHIGNFYVSQYVDENGNADGYNATNKNIVFDTVEDAEAYAKENKGYGVATDTTYLTGLIQNGTFGTQKDENGTNRVYTNYNVTDDYLTNKNRYQFMLTMDNTLAYRKAFFNVYAYMTVTAPGGTATTYISNVQTVNIYETVLSTVA